MLLNQQLAMPMVQNGILAAFSWSNTCEGPPQRFSSKSQNQTVGCTKNSTKVANKVKEKKKKVCSY